MKRLAVFLVLLSSSLVVSRDRLFEILSPSPSCRLSSDLTSQTFFFPTLSNTAYIQLMPSLNEILFNLTVCLWFFSDESKQLNLFSWATPAEPNSLKLFLLTDRRCCLYVAGKPATFLALPYERNRWNSICISWESSVGLTQLWVNGVESPKKAVHAGGSTADTPIVVLGQDQDICGGKFNITDAFVLHVTDVHMWDYGLSPCELQNYTNNMAFTPGNCLNWKTLEHNKHNYMVVDRNRWGKEKGGGV
ncbi:mucosal pentraxin-like [Arapaima gigas]